MLGKRGYELNELWLKLFGPEEHFVEPEESAAACASSSSPPSAHGLTDVDLFGDAPGHFANPESSNAHPSSSSAPSGPAHGTVLDFAKPGSSTASPSWPARLTVLDFTKPGSSTARPSSSSAPSGPAHASTDLDLSGDPPGYFTKRGRLTTRPWTSSEPAHEWPYINLFGDPQRRFAKPWSSAARPSSSSAPSWPAPVWTDIDLFDAPPDHSAKPGSSAAHLSSSSQPSAPADGWTILKQPLPSIPEEPSPVSSPEHAPPSPGSLTQSGYELMKGDAPPGPSGQASSTMSSADHELMGAHPLPDPGPSTESDHEMMNVPLSSPVSSTNPDSQSMGPESPSGKRRKTEKGKDLWFTTRD
jgi:hypothetical protein